MPNLSPELASKRDRLLELLRGLGSCAIAFSGGLDSTLLAKAAFLALNSRAVAVTGTSASLAGHELDECRELAAQIGIPLEVVETDELSNPEYLKNTGDRCYHCKRELFGRVREIADRLDLEWVLDGSNQDDQGDYRPGLQAAREQKVRSPLAECGFRKVEIRQLAAEWELPIWNKPATPCLSSRIAYGEAVTPQRLAMIEAAEGYLRAQGFQPLRVRYHRGDVARIEVDSEMLPRFVDAQFRKEVVAAIKKAGFKFVALDLEGFRSGSLNELLVGKSLRVL